MTHKALLGVAAALLVASVGIASAQPASAPASSPMKMKKPVRARVTGGPGYVSEGAASSASAASGAMVKHKARVTGGPGGTAGTPK